MLYLSLTYWYTCRNIHPWDTIKSNTWFQIEPSSIVQSRSILKKSWHGHFAHSKILINNFWRIFLKNCSSIRFNFLNCCCRVTVTLLIFFISYSHIVHRLICFYFFILIWNMYNCTTLEAKTALQCSIMSGKNITLFKKDEWAKDWSPFDETRRKEITLK